MYYLPPETADRIFVSRLAGAAFDKVQDYINFFGDRVIITGGGITATLPANGTIAVAPCTAWCKETDSDTAIGRFFDFAGVGNIALTNLATNALYLDYNAGTPQVVVTLSPLTYGFQQDHILLGAVYRDGNAVHIVNSDRLGIQGDNRSHMMRVEEGPTRSSGMVTLVAGVRNLTITAGVLHLGLIRIPTLARDTTPAGGDTFEYWYYDGSLPVPAWVQVPGATQISNTQYNDIALGLVNLTPNRYGVHWVFMDFDNHLHIVYGQGDYTAAQAENADVPAPLPNVVLMFSVIVAKIICQEGTDVLTITYPWTFPFVSAYATDHSLLANLAADDHPQYIRHALATAANDFLVAPAPGSFVKQTLAQVTAILNWAADIAAHSALVTGIHGVGASVVDSVAARNIAIAVHAALTAAGIHGSTVAATFNRLVHRDAAGRAQIVNPAVAADIDNMGARNAAIAAHAGLATGIHGVGTGTISSVSTANKTIYVDKEATGSGDGTSWADAFTTIQAAVNSLEDSDIHVYTIRVRNGTRKTGTADANVLNKLHDTGEFPAAITWVGRRVFNVDGTGPGDNWGVISARDSDDQLSIVDSAGAALDLFPNGNEDYVIEPTPYREIIYLNSLPATNPAKLILGSLTIEGEYYWNGDCEVNAVVGRIVDTGAFADVEVGDRVWVLDLNGANGRAQNAKLGTVTALIDNDRFDTDLAVTPTTNWKYTIVRTEISGSDDGVNSLRANCFNSETINNIVVNGFYLTLTTAHAMNLIASKAEYCYCIVDSTYGINLGQSTSGTIHHCWLETTHYTVQLSVSCVNIQYCCLKTSGTAVYAEASSALPFYYNYIDGANLASDLRYGSAWYVYRGTIANTCNTGAYARTNSVVRLRQTTNNAVIPVDPVGTVEGAYILIG